MIIKIKKDEKIKKKYKVKNLKFEVQNTIAKRRGRILNNTHIPFYIEEK